MLMNTFWYFRNLNNSLQSIMMSSGTLTPKIFGKSMLKRSLHVQLETKWATILFTFLKSWNWELTFTDILFGLHPNQSKNALKRRIFAQFLCLVSNNNKKSETWKFDEFRNQFRKFKMENMPYGNIFRPTATRTNYDHYLYGESLFSTVPVSSIVLFSNKIHFWFEIFFIGECNLC